MSKTPIYISNNSLRIEGQVSLICEVIAIEYLPGETINGCKIIKRLNNGEMTGVVQYGATFITTNPNFASVSEGQIITIQVDKAEYTIMSDKISIISSPYLPATESRVYKLLPLSEDYIDVLADVVARIAYEEAILSQILGGPVVDAISGESEVIDNNDGSNNSNDKTQIALNIKTTPKSLLVPSKTSWDVFNRLLSVVKSPDTKGLEIIPITKLFEITRPIYVSRDINLDLSRPWVIIWNNVKDVPGKICDSFNKAEVWLIILEDYCKHLKNIREMSQIYTDDLAASHKNLWLIYKRNMI
jgi:hypothetical protein